MTGVTHSKEATSFSELAVKMENMRETEGRCHVTRVMKWIQMVTQSLQSHSN